jgi:putative membrane protein
MMIKHHGDAQKKQDKLVKKLGLTSEESPLLSELQTGARTTTDQLQTATGTDFDVAYVNAQVQAHQQVLDAIDNRLMPSATDADLKAMLTELRPTIESHLEEARKLSSELSAAPASGPTPTPSASP